MSWIQRKWRSLSTPNVLKIQNKNKVEPIDSSKPDFQGDFTNLRQTRTAIKTGYRGTLLINEGYLYSGVQRFVNGDIVNYGETVISDINLIMPESLRASLWIGRVLRVQEGNRIVGKIIVRKIFNPILDRDLEFPCPVPHRILEDQDIINTMSKLKLTNKNHLPMDIVILKKYPKLSGQEIQLLADHFEGVEVKVKD
jgi:hypothetical protein